VGLRWMRQLKAKIPWERGPSSSPSAPYRLKHISNPNERLGISKPARWCDASHRQADHTSCKKSVLIVS